MYWKILGFMHFLEKICILQRFGAFPKSWCPEIAADVLGISFLAKLPGAEVHQGMVLP